MLCVGSPLTAWLTSRIERRTLLSVTLAVLALANAASAFAPDYASLLVIRLVMLAVGALYTPQAAGTGALIVPAARRGSTIAYIFLGWSLAAAIGLPLITFIASRYGFRAAYGGIGLLGCISFLLLVWRLPGGLIGAPVDLKTWAELSLILLSTALKMTPGICSAVPSKSTMSPLSVPFSMSVIMSVPNNGLYAGSSVWRCVDTRT
jgi:DHA1 family inner membrane transport protein